MDDGRAWFIIHLGGRYVEAMMPEGTTLEPRQWHHLAGVFDGRSVRLYVDGREVASLPGSGERTKNAFPLFIGADPDKNGKPIDHLHGRIDEVRLSSIARYTGTFEPSRHTTADEHTLLLFHLDREIGPLIPDSGPHRRHGAITGSGRCGETLRPPKR